MRFLRYSVVALLPLLFIAPVFAQSTDPQQPQVEDTTPGRRVRRPRPVNCWRQAGIAAGLINQQWKIRDEGKTRIAAVCSEASSSAQQKHDKIEQINMETEQEIAKLIPAKQMQAYKACQAEEAKNHPKSPQEKELGPCGGVIPSGSDSSMDHH